MGERVRVINRTRWNRAKGVVAFGCFIGGLAAVGGLEDNGTENANFTLGYIMLSFCFGLMWSIYRRQP